MEFSTQSAGRACMKWDKHVLFFQLIGFPFCSRRLFSATWFIQQPEEIKVDWPSLKTLLIQNFAHQNITQTALQQLTSFKQQQLEPVAQFAVKLNQLLLWADPTMSEEMKLFFLWPRLRHDISRRVLDQGPVSFHAAIQIAQRIESSTNADISITPLRQPTMPRSSLESNRIPMDIDVQNAQMSARRSLPERDAQGRPKCFSATTMVTSRNIAENFELNNIIKTLK
ncbi:hypothetical protein KP509_29G062100 [Ceratopteris richardii]|uniref:Retrotransposon gag domain-containing protein n=1 Tax=Ceratopteris richardii TaxID=49495 RepID=A0A8T2R9E0_CERRI|nr:hypothetical protein KP509_29G062100 [Ceratopteris richardii]